MALLPYIDRGAVVRGELR